jgi:hypothetical protein
VHLDSKSQDSLHERFPSATGADSRRVVLQSAPSAEVYNAYKPLFGSETKVSIKGIFCNFDITVAAMHCAVVLR